VLLPEILPHLFALFGEVVQLFIPEIVEAIKLILLGSKEIFLASLVSHVHFRHCFVLVILLLL
jgi:hypothetical protein